MSEIYRKQTTFLRLVLKKLHILSQNQGKNIFFSRIFRFPGIWSSSWVVVGRRGLCWVVAARCSSAAGGQGARGARHLSHSHAESRITRSESPQTIMISDKFCLVFAVIHIL